MRKLADTARQEITTRLANGETRSAIAKSLGVSAAHIGRLAKGKVRKAEEFSTGAAAIRAVQRQQDAGVWDIERIRNARDAQLRGEFAEPVMLARAMRTVGELFVAYHNRIAPQAAIAAELQAAAGARGKAVAKKAAEHVICPRSVLQSLTGTMANHGIAIGIVRREVNDDGTMVTMRLEEWPLEHVRWNASLERLETTIVNGVSAEPIVHGNGTWIVFRKFATDPWAQEAAVMPGALLWGALAYGVRDWASASAAHGQSKIVGELPEGFALRDENGELTPIGREFITLLQDLVSGEAGAGIKPFGSKVEFIANGSQAWQVFERLVLNREKVAARIYLGTDAILGSVGGSPGVDIAALFGVATTKIQGDFEALEQGLNTGLYQVWTAVNFGDSRYSPRMQFQLPDPDAATRIADYATRQGYFFVALKEYRANGLLVTQEVVTMLAKRFDIETPVLKPPAPTTLRQLTRLAGNFDESKHPRADDGKFGSGAGSGGGSEGDTPKDDTDREPSEREQKANKRLEEARTKHEAARKEHEAAVADHKRISQDLDDELAAKESAAKSARDEVDEHIKRLEDTEKAREEFDRSAAEAKKELPKLQKEYDEAHASFEKEQDAIFDQEGTIPDDEYEAKKDKLQKDWEAKDEDYSNRIADLESRAEDEFDGDDPADIKADIRESTKAAKAAEKELAAGRKAKEAFDKGEYSKAGKLLDKADMVDVSVDEARDAAAEVERSAKKLQRAERALKVHEKESARVAKRRDKDADGDGRTGAAEEKDDEKSDPAA